MSMRAIGVYREKEFSPGKVEADAAILDAVLSELSAAGVSTVAMDAHQFISEIDLRTDLVMAMCQGEGALRRLAEIERSGAVAINSALSIRNCYRDLLAAGLAQSGVPTPAGALLSTSVLPSAGALGGLDLSLPLFVKRGDLHALGPDDVQRAVGRADLEARMASFARRGIPQVYVQQEFAGDVVKFYGVSGGSYFCAIADSGELPESILQGLSEAAQRAALMLGLEAWGGDAVLSGDRFAIIDFNDWPSYSRVRMRAAQAIARRALALVRTPAMARA